MVRLRQDSIAQEAIDLNLAKEGYTAYYVDGTNGLDTYPGDSWEQPFKTIQHAIDEAESWCKIYVKAGTYDEHVRVDSGTIHLIGESRANTIIKKAVYFGASTMGCHIENFRIEGAYSGYALFSGDVYVLIEYCSLYPSADGILISGEYGTVRRLIGGGGTIYIRLDGGGYHEVYDCITHEIDNFAIGMFMRSGNNKVHDCTFLNNTGFGVQCDTTAEYNVVYHNNLLSNATQVQDNGSHNTWLENFYDDHTTDTNNDGLCDTAYSFTGGTDYQPVSQRNGWKQESLGYDSAAGGDATAANQTTIITETDKLKGVEITGNTGAIAHSTETDCSAVIGQNGERSILRGGIIRGIQTLAAGKKATIKVYKYNGATWDLVDSFDVTKDSSMEANLGRAAHNDYMKITVEHDDTAATKTFTYAFVVQHME